MQYYLYRREVFNLDPIGKKSHLVVRRRTHSKDENDQNQKHFLEHLGKQGFDATIKSNVFSMHSFFRSVKFSIYILIGENKPVVGENLDFKDQDKPTLKSKKVTFFGNRNLTQGWILILKPNPFSTSVMLSNATLMEE